VDNNFNVLRDSSLEWGAVHLVDHHGWDPDTADMDFIVSNNQCPEPWRDWFKIHGETVFDQATPVEAVSRRQEHLDLFKVGFNGEVLSCWWHDDGGGWRPWFPINHNQPNVDVFDQVTPVKALARRPDHLDLFVTDHDSQVWSCWWHEDGQDWRPWFKIHPETGSFRTDHPVAAVARMPEHIDLFGVGFDGAVRSSWWPFEGDPGKWHPWFEIHPEEKRFAVTSRVTAISRRPDHLDLFVTGVNGAVWSTWRDAGDGLWSSWFPIHPDTVFDQRHPVAAIARYSEHLDLFKVGPSGAVMSTWWSVF